MSVGIDVNIQLYPSDRGSPRHERAADFQQRCAAGNELFCIAYRQVTHDVPARDELAPDAHLAAVLRQHGVLNPYTQDRDFRKFDFLDVVDPLA